MANLAQALSTFTAVYSQPAPATDDPSDYYKFTFPDSSWFALQVSLFQSDVIDQDVIDSAVEWADYLKHFGGADLGAATEKTPLCWDQDTCRFFFDGTVIETIFTSSGDLDTDFFGDDINLSIDGVTAQNLYLCTMSLTEEQQDRLLPYVHSQWIQNADPWNIDDFAEMLDASQDQNDLDSIFWQCGKYDRSILVYVDEPRFSKESAKSFSYDLDGGAEDQTQFGWLNDTTNDIDASGFGSYLIDWESITQLTNYVTNWRQTMFVYENIRAGMPYYYELPSGAQTYADGGLIPTMIYNRSKGEAVVALLNIDGAVATFAGAGALIAILATIA